MKTRQWLISLAMLTGSVASAVAQEARCAERDAVGYIGIEGIDCNCTIASPGSGREWSFRTEPRITQLNMDTRAGAVLKIGDAITHVNGKLITTRDGAQELANIDPGEAVVLTIRRNGQSLKYALTAQGVCPTDTRLLGIYAPGQRLLPAPSAAAPHGAAPSVRVPVPPSSSRTPTPAVPAARVPRATFGMGLSCSNCSIHMSDKTRTAVMTFSKPPEVYSIERGGPADRAGIRRGDVLTHINDLPLDSEKGGEAFANAKPGEVVRFTVQRGSDRRTYSVRAASRVTTAVAPSLAESSESLERARHTLAELQREQEQQLRQLQEHVRRSRNMEASALEEVQRELLRVERQHKDKLAQISRELTRADGRMRALSDSARAVCAVPLVAPIAGTNRTLRYTGTLGASEIEVRGASPVSVSETKDEVVITTGGTVVKVRKSK